MSLVYFAFKGSFLAYNAKPIIFTASTFFIIMCIIGAFYMFHIFNDFKSVGSISTPDHCQAFESSKITSIIIMSGASCDAVWSIVCLLLFYFRLRKLTKLMNAIQLGQTVNVQKDEKSQSKSDKSKQHKKCRSRSENDVIHQFLPILVKLVILSSWCALSTLILGFSLWTMYPTIASVIDSTLNAFCVYLCFSCNDKVYQVLCLPFISCKHCRHWRRIIAEAKEMAKSKREKITSMIMSTSTANNDDITRQRTITRTMTTTINADELEITQTEAVTIIDDSGCEYQKEISFKHHKTHISIQLDGIRAVLHSSDESPSTIQTIGSTLTTPIEFLTPIAESDGGTNNDYQDNTPVTGNDNVTPVGDDHEVP